MLHCKDFYPDAHESIPVNPPDPRGKLVTTRCIVDANYAGSLMTHRSHSEIIVYLMNTPIIWWCKCQNTVETSFSNEFIALRKKD